MKAEKRVALTFWTVIIVAFGLYSVYKAEVVPVSADDEPVVLMQQPYGVQQDTFAIIVGDTLTRAINIRGAKRVGLYVPTIDATDLILHAGYNTDSTFVRVYKESAAGDTLIAWTLHNGTGAFAMDLTDYLSGFDYFKIETGDTMTVIRTFHYTLKY